MLSGKLITIGIMIMVCLAGIASEGNIITDVMNKSGFDADALNYKKDFGNNDYYINPSADRILNEPLYFYKFRDSVIKSMSKRKITIYDDIDNVYELINIHTSNINDILRHEIPLDFEKSVSIVSLIPLLFYEDSMDYMYRGALERNLNATGDICRFDAETLFAYLKDINPNTDSMEMLSHAFIERLRNLYVKGFDWGTDTFIEAGHVIIGTVDDDIYSMDCDFIIDPGGNDQYIGQCGVVYPYTKRVKFIVDFAGNDTYSAADSFSLSAGAINGVAVLCDMQGDDIYRTYNFSQGAAFLGLSMLIDMSGNDYYTAGIFSQGAGAFGKGILLDVSGNDIYTGSAYNQGMGFVRGIGMLIDSAGNDMYRSGTFIKHKPLLKDDYLSMGQGFGLGLRPDYAGGLGLLLDNAGNDIFHASVFGQGSAYWHAIGMLIDNGGNDYYQGAEYLQGAGIHIAAGGLFDRSGDDMYFSRFGPSQGEGHDWGVGVLTDDEGDDNYTVSGGQGVGLANGVGIFLDKGGRDSYFTSEHVHNGDVTIAREFYGYGIFIDMAENDFYSQHSDTELITIKNVYGLKYDDTVSVKEIYPDTFSIDGNADIESLFNMASMWEVREVKPLVNKARSVFNKREDALGYILENKMDTQSGLELRALVSFFKENSDESGGHLIDILSSNDEQKIKNALYVIGKTEYSTAYSSVKKLTGHSDESIVLNAVHAIGLLETDDALNYMINIYNDCDNYRIKIEVLTALINHNEDFHELFLNEFSNNEQLNYALARYLASFEGSVKKTMNAENKDFNDYLVLYIYMNETDDSMLIDTPLPVNEGDSPRIQFLKKYINSKIE